MKKEAQALLLGRFEVGKLLGHGTFAKVYHARNMKANEGVAIKVIDKEKSLKGGLRGRERNLLVVGGPKLRSVTNGLFKGVSLSTSE
jgi:serine/threonine protein kinase